MSDKYVWYACYGSNLLKERFMGYILGGGIKSEDGCRDKTPPVKEMQITIPHELYFSKKSSKWGNGGVAFLKLKYIDEANTLGRAYLITEEQFEDVKRQEGGWYSHELALGHMEGWPVMSFTCSPETEKNPPTSEYLDIITRGLKETYQDVDEEKVESYLSEHF